MTNRMRSSALFTAIAAAVVLVGVLGVARADAAFAWDPNSIHEVWDPGSGIYSYAPSTVEIPDGQLIWSCENQQPYVIRDHVYLTERIGGRTQGDILALGPDQSGTWDSYHICDPSIVGGRFRYQGTFYRYAMFFTGNDQNASDDNEVGVAYSNSLLGGWVRYPEPIIGYPQTGAWGVGQPSAVSLNGQGQVVLFFTHGASDGTYGVRAVLDLTNADNPVIGPQVPVPTAGLIGTDGQQDVLNDFDIAYSPGQARYYMVRDQHPNPPSDPNYISGSVQVDSMSAQGLWSGNGTWRVEGDVTPALTGQARNHDAGLVRTLDGDLPNPGSVTVNYAVSCAGSACPITGPLYTYRLWEVTGATEG